MKVGFETIVKHVPAEVLDVRSHYAYLEPAVARLPRQVRARVRRAAPEQVRRLKDISAAEIMGLGAAQKALDSGGLTPADIDGLFVAQTGGKQYMPLLGSYIHLNVGLKPHTIVRNIVDDNVSALDAAYVAWNFVRSGLCRRVLLVTVAAQIGGQTAFGVDLTDPLAQNYGDGAAAAVISSENLKCEFLAYHSETYAVKSRPGGTLNGNFGPIRPLANPDLAAKAGVENKSGAYLTLEDPLFDKIIAQKGFITETLERAIKKTGLSLRDVGLVITPHIGHLEDQWKKELEEAGLSKSVCRNFRSKYGSVAVAEPLTDLAELDEERLIPEESIVTLWVPCMGVQLATLVLRWSAQAA